MVIKQWLSTDMDASSDGFFLLKRYGSTYFINKDNIADPEANNRFTLTLLME